MVKNIRFEEWESEQMQDPEFRAAMEELEPAYQITRLRLMRGLTQEQLAELVGTKQSSIARLESGNSQPRLSFLRQVVRALNGYLVVSIAPIEDMIMPNVVAYASDEAGSPRIETRNRYWSDKNQENMPSVRATL